MINLRSADGETKIEALQELEKANSSADISR